MYETIMGPISAPAALQKAVILHQTPDLDLAQTLDCGQAFRWESQPDGSYTGVAFGRICHISQNGDTFRFDLPCEADFTGVWRDYFDLGRDYGALKRRFSADPVLAQAVAYAPGIRLLRQEPWEALCSFIISQNNHVPRIKGIIQRLCACFGEPLAPGFYAFPTPQAIAALSPGQLAPLRAGFRARYLIDAAQKVASGLVQLESLRSLPLDQARAQLMQITGVGPKVADCTLLYGCGRLECVPVDVWIGRALHGLFPDGLPDCVGPYAGIAQQYLFHYMRTCMGKQPSNAQAST